MTGLRLDRAPSPTRCRVVMKRAERREVDRKARVIRGLSAITRGEALGHGLWIDDHFLDQLEAAGQALERGAKSRFTHPDMSSDGMGRFLGRARAFERDGGKVRVDLKLARAASRAPEGDLAGYVLELAEEDPHAFGASIVFMRDLEAEHAFATTHMGGDGSFVSPDPENKGNLRHARLKELFAVDLVDEPAANPDGVFSRAHPTFELLEDIGPLASYLLGLSEEAPTDRVGGIDLTRARAYVARFMEQRGLALASKEVVMSKKNDQGAASSAPAPEAPARKLATIGELKAEFAGRPEFVLEQLEKGVTIEEARSAFQKLRIEELEKENASLKAKASEPAPATTPASSTPPKPAGVPPVPFAGNGAGVDVSGDFMELARTYRDEHFPKFAGTRHGGMREALSACAKSHPEAYAAWRRANGIKTVTRQAR